MASPEENVIRLMRERFADLAARRRFSLRAYARMLGLNPTQLSETLNGRRRLTRKVAARVLDRLGVDAAEGVALLEAIPAAKRARSVAKPDAHLYQYIQLSTDEFRVVADWYYFALLSLAETRGFRSQPAWIARRLGIAEREARGAVGTLLRLGLLEKRGRALRATGKQFTTSNDVPDASVRRAHAQGLDQAREALDRVPVELREFGATIIAGDPRLLPRAKKRLRAMRREIAALLQSGERREVYRLAVQLFPVSKQVQ